MSTFAQNIDRVRWLYDHHALHDLSDEKVMHTYYGALLWVYATAAIAGGYEGVE
jgi:hypothetical protein